MIKFTKSARTFLPCLIALICLIGQSGVETARLQQRQRQRLQAQQFEPYPAAGFRPGRQFILPQEQPQEQSPFDQPLDEQEQEQEQEQTQTQTQTQDDFLNTGEIQPHRPEPTYGAPPSSQLPSQPSQSSQRSQFERLVSQRQFQRQFFVPRQRSNSQRLTAPSALKSARLIANNENIDDENEIDGNDIASDVDTDIDIKTENAPRTVTVGSQQPTTVYYPAGAVSFFQPLTPTTFAAQAPATAPITSQPAPNTATFIQPLHYSNFPLQSVATVPAPATVAAPANVAAPAPATALLPSMTSKLQIRPLATAAKLQTQPVAAISTPASVPASAAVASPFYLASPTIFSSTPNAAYTASFAQPQFYVTAAGSPAPTTALASAQLQTW